MKNRLSDLSNTLRKTTNWPQSSTQRQALEERQRAALHDYRLALEQPRYNCAVCRDTELVTDPAHDNAAMPCPACAPARRAERLQSICGLTERERGIDFTKIVAPNPSSGTARMLKAAREFVAAPYGMVTIYGTCGNAKTLTLQAVVNELLARNVAAIYTTFYDVVAWVRESFAERDAPIGHKIAQLRNIPVLCIDELDKVKPTEWVVELQTQLIDWRYRRGLSRQCGTVFAMNGDLDALPAWLASRLRDGRNVVVVNNDNDLRPLLK